MRMKPLLAAAVCGAVLVPALVAQAPDAGPADAWYNAVRGASPRLHALLVENPAGVNLRERRGGVTPLMHAAALGSLDTMRLLLDKGADVNAKSAAGATALMWAAADPAKVRLLVERGADVKAVSESGRTALLLAAMSDQSAETVRLLLERGADAKALDREQTSTLVAAAYGNDTESLRQLLKAGAPVNQANIAGTTPLMNAASNGNNEAVKLLLAAGANVNAQSGPPGQQVKNGKIDLGRFTPLILASAFGPATVVKTLLDAGANVNAKEARGMTPLMYAAATDHGDIEIARMLVARGADLNVKSNAGETALDWANKTGSTPLAALLRKAGAPARGGSAAHRAGRRTNGDTGQPSQRGVALLERVVRDLFHQWRLRIVPLAEHHRHCRRGGPQGRHAHQRGGGRATGGGRFGHIWRDRNPTLRAVRRSGRRYPSLHAGRIRGDGPSRRSSHRRTRLQYRDAAAAQRPVVRWRHSSSADRGRRFHADRAGDSRADGVCTPRADGRNARAGAACDRLAAQREADHGRGSRVPAARADLGRCGRLGPARRREGHPRRCSGRTEAGANAMSCQPTRTRPA